MTITGGLAHSSVVRVTVTNTDSALAAFAPIQFRENRRVEPQCAMTIRLGTPGGRGSDRLTLSVLVVTLLISVSPICAVMNERVMVTGRSIGVSP